MRAALGLLPLVGAFLSIFWMLLAKSRPEMWGSAIAAWFLGCVTHPLGAIVLIQALYTALQSVLWQRYRPFKRPEGSTFRRSRSVIPAFNEGPMVQAKHPLGRPLSNYPEDKLEIIVVDDGFPGRHLFSQPEPEARVSRSSG